jgi:threonine synthase
MDVGNPSNFERLREVFKPGWEDMASRIQGRSVTDERTMETMRRVHAEHGRIVEPHTAVGIAAAWEYLAGAAGGADGGGASRGGQRTARAVPEREQVIVLSTAHPAKFSDIVRKATGVTPEMPDRLARCLSLPKQSLRIGTTLAQLSEFLLDSFA